MKKRIIISMTEATETMITINIHSGRPDPGVPGAEFTLQEPQSRLRLVVLEQSAELHTVAQVDPLVRAAPVPLGLQQLVGPVADPHQFEPATTSK
jgi:hypothetical protein